MNNANTCTTNATRIPTCWMVELECTAGPHSCCSKSNTGFLLARGWNLHTTTENLCPSVRSHVLSAFLPMAGQILAHHHRESLSCTVWCVGGILTTIIGWTRSYISGGSGCLWCRLLKFSRVSCVFGVLKQKWGVLCLLWFFYFAGVRNFNIEGGAKVRRKILRVWFSLVCDKQGKKETASR